MTAKWGPAGPKQTTVVSPKTFTFLLAKAKEWDCTVEEAASRLVREYVRDREREED